jgi:hypothetical protein
MRWRWRDQDAVTSSEREDDSLARAEASTQEALTQLEESFHVRQMVQTQRERGTAIAAALHKIREQNHFQEMWNDGLRGG